MSTVPALIAALVLAIPPALANPAPTDRVMPELRAALDAAGPREHVAGYLVMADQLRPEQLVAERRLPSRARRAAVAERLKVHARQSQSDLRARLDQAVEQGSARVVAELWMGNAVMIAAEPSVWAELASLPGVDRAQIMPTAGDEIGQDVAPPMMGASYPFFDDFESGSLSADWTVTTTGSGLISVESDHDPIDSFHLTMESADDGTDSTASITVELDLTGQTDVGIRFKHKEFGDEDDTGDGIFVSEDGAIFQEVLSLNGGTSLYTTRYLELDTAISGLGLSYTDTFHIRFQWEDNFSIPTDGFAFDEIEIAPGVGVPGPPEPEPNIVGHQAPLLWDLGIDGSGVLIGNIDSGTYWPHPDLVDRIWVNPGEIEGNGQDDDGNGYIDDIRGWDFDNDTNDVTATDSDSHGTKSAGIAVGDGTSGRSTGMAPGATMVVTEVEIEADYWLAQQYLLDVGVDVITSSYSWKWPSIPRPDYHMSRQLCEMELAAGIIHANSIGNQGSLQGTHPIPFNISTPGNCPSPWGHPDQSIIGGATSVMACGGITLPNDDPYSSSGEGPSAWEDVTLYDAAYPHLQDPAYWDYAYGGFGGSGPGLLKPDIVAYTVNILTTTIGTGYDNFGGTSAATPHLGGAMCLLRQFQPEAEPRHIAAALELTATDLGVAGKDNDFGSGKFQVYDAARRLQVLGRFDDTDPIIGTTLTLDVFGPDSAVVFWFLSGIQEDIPGVDWNLGGAFLDLPPIFLGPTGSAQLQFPLPNNPSITDIPVYIQFGAENTNMSFDTFDPLLSVPERLTLRQ